MTHPGDGELDDILGGLDADPWEREQLREVLAEVDGDDDGPWHDQLGDALDDAYGAEAARLAEDAEDAALLAKRPRDEVRLARALDRIGNGTYTPPGYFRPARGGGGQFASACGPADELGGCAARYHQSGCPAVYVTDAANGSFEDAEAWNAVVRGHAPPPGAGEIGLAAPGPRSPAAASEMTCCPVRSASPAAPTRICTPG